MNFINTSAAWTLAVILLTSCASAPTVIDTPKTVAETKNTNRVNSPIAEAIVQFDRGRDYYSNKEYAESYKLWILAADAKILEAYNNLGYLNYYGLGVKQNLEKGVKQWRIAADNGYSESQIHLSEAYAEGISLQKNLVEAYAWAKAAAYFTPYLGDDDLRKTFEQDSKALIQKYSPKLSQTALKQAKERANALILTISETLKTTPYIRRFPPKVGH